jgi:SPP1 family phage portal protein
MIIRDADKQIDEALILGCLREHLSGAARLDKLDNYYKGEHNILNRRKQGQHAPNNKLVCNFAKYITDTAIGYVFGSPVKYENAGNLEDFLKRAAAHDSELAKDLSVFGEGCELVLFGENGAPELLLLDPRNTFLVYDDTLRNKPFFAVYFAGKADNKGYRLYVYTDKEVSEYEADGGFSSARLVRSSPHYLSGIPIIGYKNNEEGQGDFEGVISLLDAYNLLQSDRINDKQAFVDAILVLRNFAVSEGDAAVLQLEKNRILQLPGENTDAFYITKTLSETDSETLKKAVASDIHKFSQVPDFTDERFAGNSSGVALKYKLLSLENLAKIKERFFSAGLKRRLALLSNAVQMKGGARVDADEVNIVFNRSLPVNTLETAQTLNELRGLVSAETLLSQLSFVGDPKEELDKLREEKEQAAKTAAKGFNSGYPE